MKKARKRRIRHNRRIVTCTKSWICAIRFSDILIFWVILPGLAAALNRFYLETELFADYTEAQSYIIAIAVSLIPGLLVFACRLVVLKAHRLIFFEKYVIDRWGVLSKYERKYAYLGTLAISSDANLIERLMNMANMEIHVVGKTFYLKHACRPNYIKRRVNRYILNAEDMRLV